MVWASDERQFNLRRQACWFVFRVDNVARAQNSTGWWKIAPVRSASWWMLPGAGATLSPGPRLVQSAWWYHEEKGCLMKSSLRIIIAGLLLVLSHTVMAETLDRDTVIERLIKSYGGEDNLRKANTMVQEWGLPLAHNLKDDSKSIFYDTSQNQLSPWMIKIRLNF